ncbi:MAG: DnaA N-terminal domain-containing protein, partial [Woeseiaceae bacterium]
MRGSLWLHCLRHLESEVPEQQFNTWVRPLQAVERDGELQLLAPNRFVVSWIEKNLYGRIEQLVSDAGNGGAPRVTLEIGSRREEPPSADLPSPVAKPREAPPVGGRINPDFTFATFVEGKSNQLARAAAVQVGENPGRAYNPLFIYGGV